MRFSVTTRGSGDSGSFGFLIDENMRAFKSASYGTENLYPSGSATVSLKVKAGQIVQIQNFGLEEIFGTGSIGSMDSWFTGHLLYAL